MKKVLHCLINALVYGWVIAGPANIGVSMGSDSGTTPRSPISGTLTVIRCPDLLCGLRFLIWVMSTSTTLRFRLVSQSQPPTLSKPRY